MFIVVFWATVRHRDPYLRKLGGSFRITSSGLGILKGSTAASVLPDLVWGNRPWTRIAIIIVGSRLKVRNRITGAYKNYGVGS